MTFRTALLPVSYLELHLFTKTITNKFSGYQWLKECVSFLNEILTLQMHRRKLQETLHPSERKKMG